MKFSELPKFKKTCDQGVNIPLFYLKRKIEEDQKELGLQLCPDFQRGHVWTETQQTQYLEYILMGGRSGRDIWFNHTGWMRSFEGEYVLVDGLQRITACIKFLDNKLCVFGYYYNQFEDRLGMTEYTLIFHVETFQTKKEVLEWYIEMNSGGTPHTNDEIDRVKKMILDL